MNFSTIPTVLPIDFENERTFLAIKNSGAGKGKWMGFGGKVEIGETVLEAAIRETSEETSIPVTVQQIAKVGIVLFTFQNDASTALEMHVFVTEGQRFEHGVTLNDEFYGSGKWFSRTELPLDV